MTSQSLTSQTSEPAQPMAGDSPCNVVRCDGRVGPAIKDHGETTLQAAGSSEEAAVLWKTLPTAATFVSSTLAGVGRASKPPPTLVCRPALGNPDLSCCGIPLLSAPNLTPSADSEQEGHWEEDGQHGRLLHADNRYS